MITGEHDKKDPISMTIENTTELMQECYPEHLCMGTRRMKDKKLKKTGRAEELIYM